MIQRELETERLLLRPFRREDGARVQLLAGEWAIADTTLQIPHPYEDGVAEEWISTLQPKFETGELAFFAIVLRAEEQVIGAIGLTIEPGFDRAEIGYWVGVPYWGKGYCTEAAAAIFDYGFDDLNLHRIHARYLSRNPSSGKIMQKLGMTYEGLQRKHGKKWDKYEDVVLYGILREEWNQLRANKANSK